MSPTQTESNCLRQLAPIYMRQRDSSPQQHRDLRVVAARVRGPRLSVGKRMVGNGQRIHFACDRYAWARATERKIRLYATDCKPGCDRISKLRQCARDDSRGLLLTKPELRVVQYVLSEGDDLFSMPVDRIADLRLQRFA